MKAIVLASILFSFSSSLARPDDTEKEPFDSSAGLLNCRDFPTISDFSLPVCDIISADKLKTDLVANLINLQNDLDDLMKNASATETDKKRYKIIKDNLSAVERYTVSTMIDVCNLKGAVVTQGSNLVAGCIYNQLNKIKTHISKVMTPIQFEPTDANWPHVDVQADFDLFVDQLLVDLADKNQKNAPNNQYQKYLMSEILHIYGPNNGQSLYLGFLGACSLEAMSQTSNSKVVDSSSAMSCEEKYLNDLQQILLIALNKN